MLCGNLPLRIYFEKNPDDTDDITIWYFGFPKKIIDPLKDFLGTSLYWDTKFDKEDDAFYIIPAGVVGDYDKSKLSSMLRFRMQMYNMCLNTVTRMAQNAAKKV